jgi:hypothetical protein
MGVPSPTPAPTPFPEGDPRNGKYFENVAALEHQLKNSLAGDQQDITAAQAAYDYNTGQLDHQLPLTLQATRNTANAQGLLESGQLTQRAGTVESKYAAQRGRLTSNLQTEQNRVHEAENSANESFNLGRSKAAQAAREESKTQLEKEAPNEQPGAAPATQAPKVVGPHGESLPYAPTPAQISGVWGSPGSVLPTVIGQTAQPITGTKAARKQAAKKAVG